MHVCSSASPTGGYVAYVKDSILCRQNLRRREPAVAGCRVIFDDKAVQTVKWTSDGSRLLVTSPRGVQVVDTEDFQHLASISNGGGGLGKIASVDFIGINHLLLIWEFGKVKLWHLTSGKATDLPDAKTTCDGRSWQSRPGNHSPALFALLCRIGAEDHLALHFTSPHQAHSLARIPTTDVQSLSWSPDGRWLALLDVPSGSPNLYIYTPDGHLFRSYPSAKAGNINLGIKSITWSADGRMLALARHDNQVELLNTRTFSPLALIEHHMTIDQGSLPVSERAHVWQENVSATGERTYTFAAQPVSPPLSRTKASLDLSEQGIAEAVFSCDGSYLATRDCSMLNTVWIWSMATMSAHSVLIQHNNVRKLAWHPTRAGTLLVDCGDGTAHVANVATTEPPATHSTGAHPTARLSWVHTASGENPAIMVLQRNQYRLLFPEGREGSEDTPEVERVSMGPTFEEGGSEDSLFEVLSGRKPLPPKTAPSYTEMIDIDVEAEETVEGGLDDTFREKRKPLAEDLDPLDDSEIF